MKLFDNLAESVGSTPMVRLIVPLCPVTSNWMVSSSTIVICAVNSRPAIP